MESKCRRQRRTPQEIATAVNLVLKGGHAFKDVAHTLNFPLSTLKKYLRLAKKSEKDSTCDSVGEENEPDMMNIFPCVQVKMEEEFDDYEAGPENDWNPQMNEHRHFVEIPLEYTTECDPPKEDKILVDAEKECPIDFDHDLDNQLMSSDSIQIEETLDEVGRRQHHCLLCDVTHRKLDHLLQHMSVAHKGHVYLCQICRQLFTTNAALQLHINAHADARLQLLQCEMCGLQSASRRAFDAHLRRHVEASAFQFACNTCGQVFCNLKRLSSHVAETHCVKVALRFCCALCPFRSNSDAAYQLHVKQHHNTTSECDLTNHERSHQPSTHAQTFVCSQCDVTFEDDDALQAHVVTCRRRFKCDGCKRHFAKKLNLDKHRVIHRRKRFCCRICDKVYNYSTAYLKHLIKHKVNSE